MLGEVSSGLFIFRAGKEILVGLFKKVEAATETAKRGINTSLVVSAVACLIAVVALLLAVAK